jgi:hypothetical protein
MPVAKHSRFCALGAVSIVAAVVALAASNVKSAVFDPPSETSPSNPLWGMTPNGIPWSAVASGTVLPVRTSASSAFDGAPGAVVYFNTVTGQMQIDPKNLDLSTVIITYTTGTVNIVAATPGPFTYSTGTGVYAYSPSTGTPRTFPPIDSTSSGLPPTTFPSRVAITLGPPLGPSLATTTGYWNIPWSFPLDLVASGSVGLMTIENFKTIGQNSNANANILGYSPGASTFQYSVSGVVGNQVGAVVAVAVPEPSAYMMALAGLACCGYSLFRRRRAR